MTATTRSSSFRSNSPRANAGKVQISLEAGASWQRQPGKEEHVIHEDALSGPSSWLIHHRGCHYRARAEVCVRDRLAGATEYTERTGPAAAPHADRACSRGHCPPPCQHGQPLFIRVSRRDALLLFYRFSNKCGRSWIPQGQTEGVRQRGPDGGR